MSNLTEYSVAWQQIVILLYALEHIGEIPGRAQTMDHIRQEGLLALRRGDLDPYPSCHEPSWQTDIAWARKHAVILDYVSNHDWNSWELIRPGREFIRPIFSRFRDGTLILSQCFLFSPELKRRLSEGQYTRSASDRNAPPKGNSSMPDTRECRRLLQQQLQDATIGELALRISRKLGLNIPATETSVAFAYQLHRKQQMEARADID